MNAIPLKEKKYLQMFIIMCKMQKLVEPNPWFVFHYLLYEKKGISIVGRDKYTKYRNSLFHK